MSFLKKIKNKKDLKKYNDALENIFAIENEIKQLKMQENNLVASVKKIEKKYAE